MKIETTIIISIISGTGGGGLIYFLLKTYLTEKIKGEIKNHYDLKLEAAKGEIKHEYDIKFETARKELEKKATEHQIQYSKLHIERTEKLRDIHEKLIETEKALEHFVHPSQGPGWTEDTEREKKAWTQYEELVDTILKRQIYFPTDLCNKVDSLTEEYKSVIVEMSVAKDMAKLKLSGDVSPYKTWIGQRDRLKGQIKVTRGLIEGEFRKLLGV